MNILKHGYCVQMHYKSGVILLALVEKEAGRPKTTIHKYERIVNSLEEAFRIYKVYLIFAEKDGYRTAIYYFANMFSVDIKGKDLDQIIKAVDMEMKKY